MERLLPHTLRNRILDILFDYGIAKIVRQEVMNFEDKAPHLTSEQEALLKIYEVLI